MLVLLLWVMTAGTPLKLTVGSMKLKPVIVTLLPREPEAGVKPEIEYFKTENGKTSGIPELTSVSGGSAFGGTVAVMLVALLWVMAAGIPLKLIEGLLKPLPTIETLLPGAPEEGET
jgi:hypothetical protein